MISLYYWFYHSFILIETTFPHSITRFTLQFQLVQKQLIFLIILILPHRSNITKESRISRNVRKRKIYIISTHIILELILFDPLLKDQSILGKVKRKGRRGEGGKNSFVCMIIMRIGSAGTIKEMANPFLPWDSHNAVTNVGAEEKAQGPPMLQQSNQSRHSTNDASKTGD